MNRPKGLPIFTTMAKEHVLLRFPAYGLGGDVKIRKVCMAKRCASVSGIGQNDVKDV